MKLTIERINEIKKLDKAQFAKLSHEELFDFMMFQKSEQDKLDSLVQNIGKLNDMNMIKALAKQASVTRSELLNAGVSYYRLLLKKQTLEKLLNEVKTDINSSDSNTGKQVYETEQVNVKAEYEKRKSDSKKKKLNKAKQQDVLAQEGLSILSMLDSI